MVFNGIMKQGCTRVNRKFCLGTIIL